MTNDTIQYELIKPDPSISHLVESFWMLTNHSAISKEIVVLPDGRIDIFFSYSSMKHFQVILIGLETEPSITTIPPATVTFAVSLKLLAIEYLLQTNISQLVNSAVPLPMGFWGITKKDMNDFPAFCINVCNKIKELAQPLQDKRKQTLFELVYTSGGSMPVKELAEKVFWTSRQINRYFSEHFGLSLKTYCTILRFRASFQHLKAGKLFPEQNFSDQPHFIKEIKKLSGVIPKELSKNKNDRFIQFSVLP